MPKVVKPLSAIEVKRLSGSGMHAVGTVSGLHLNISQTNTTSWVLRKKYAGKRHEIGLGAYPEVGLALAISRAREITDDIYRGVDPIAKRKEARATIVWTFKRCAEEYIESFAPKWKNDKTRQAWENTLSTYCYPIFGQKPVKDITVNDVTTVLKPDWVSKHVTMSRVRQRIEKVLGWATAMGYRIGNNPAALKDNLEDLLPSNFIKPEPHPALQKRDVQAFASALSTAEGQGAKCLYFAMLTACRSGEARGATWSEINLEAAEWRIPATRMKKKVEHLIPLSDSAMTLLKSLVKFKGTDLIFVGNENRQISDMTLLAVIKRMNKAKLIWVDNTGRPIVPHGLRSTFATWLQESTNYPTELREHALAHSVGNAVTQSYERGTQFEKRRQMMEDWGKFVSIKDRDV